MKKRCFICFIALVFNGPPLAAESMKLEIIPLQSRPVTEVIPIVRPLLVKGGVVTGMNNRLIVKSTPANINAIKSILSQLDKPRRNLLISVKQNINDNINTRESSLSGRYSADPIRITAPDPGRGGSVIQGTDRDGNRIRYRRLDTRSRLDDRNVFRVQTLDGTPAYINTGQSVPIPTQTTVVTGGGVVLRDGIEYRDVSSGFYVLPRLQGDNVTLLIAPRLSRVGSGAPATFDVQKAETTVRGKLGEWIALGGITRQFNNKNSRNLGSSGNRQNKQRQILIKVDETK